MAKLRTHEELIIDLKAKLEEAEKLSVTNCDKDCAAQCRMMLSRLSRRDKRVKELESKECPHCSATDCNCVNGLWEQVRGLEEGVTMYQVRATKAEQRVEELSVRYNELIMAVGKVYPDESRHETALRYIVEAENRCSGPAQEAPKGGE